MAETVLYGIPNCDTAKAARLLEDNPSMIKRPIVEHEGGLLVGFKEDEWSAHFS